MAKKKQVQTEESPLGSENFIHDLITEKFGNILISAENIPSGKVIPICLGFDLATNGGLVEGTITHIAAPTKSGKTTLALHMVAKMQRALKKEAYFIDVEGRLRPELLKDIAGLVWTEEESKATGIPALKIIRSTDEKTITAEDYFNISHHIFTNLNNVILVFDSLAMLESNAQHGNDLGESSMLTEIPKLTYTWLRKISPSISSKTNNLITLTHVQDSPSRYGPGKREVGGNAIKYMASNHFVHQGNEIIRDSAERAIGQVTKFKVEKNALGAPYQEFNVCITYGRGIDEARDAFILGCQFGQISKSGAWYEIEYGDEPKKFQGELKTIEAIRSDPEMMAWLTKEIRTMVLGPDK